MLYFDSPRLMSKELRSTYNADDIFAVIEGQIMSDNHKDKLAPVQKENCGTGSSHMKQ